MKKRYMAAATTLAVALTAGGLAMAQPASAQDGPDPELLEEALEAFEAAEVPSTIAEVRDGDETWSGATGDRALDGDEAAEPTDHVRVASLTKSMVSTVALQLVDEGQLSLDDTVNEYLPYDEPITVEQLLDHTSGVPDYVHTIYPSIWEGSAEDVRTNRLNEYTPEELVANGTDYPLLFPPGEDHGYSNTNYIVLGLLIEDVTGDDLADNLDTRVMEPAGMDSSYLPATEPVPEDPYTHPYFATGEEDEPLLDTSDLSPTQLWAGWGVISTPGDANAFFRAMFDGTLLPPELAAQAQEPTPQSDGYYGLGIQLDDMLPDECHPVPDGVTYGHSGSGLGHSTLSFHSPDGQRQASLTYAVDSQLEISDELIAAVSQFISAGMCDSEPDEEPSAADLDRLLIDRSITQ